MAKEQYVKVRVVIERTYLIPVKDGTTYGTYTPEELKEQWFGPPDALNRANETRDASRLGNADTILSAEIVQVVDAPEGTL
jgi:hypothetical protein